MISRTIISGRLTADPALRYTPSGVGVATFTVAVERPFKNAQGERETDFYECVVWRKLADLVVKFTEKGRLINLEGRMQCRSYTNQEGQKRKAWELLVENVQFVEWKKNGQNEPPSPANDDLSDVDLDSLPF